MKLPGWKRDVRRNFPTSIEQSALIVTGDDHVPRLPCTEGESFRPDAGLDAQINEQFRRNALAHGNPCAVLQVALEHGCDVMNRGARMWFEIDRNSVHGNPPLLT